MPIAHTVRHPAQLLDFLFAAYPDLKRAKVQQLLNHGAIQVNGRPTTRFNHPLQPGDVVTVRSKHETSVDRLLPARMSVMWEDASLLVIEKPAGLLSMASHRERRKTAYAYLTDYVRRGDPRSTERVWIVHRLDREASGLMVFAKTEDAKKTLQMTWREASKRYLAVVEGRPPADHGELRSHLDESGPFKVYSAAPTEQTRLAVTNYQVLKQGSTAALVELTLVTGRRNQIRVQLADVKCPIVGDQKYGARTDSAGRLALHASSLQFNHPSSGEHLSFQAPLPPELEHLV